MKEDYLHFVWQAKRLHIVDLYTTDGQRIDIIDFGKINRDAGPDFLEGRIRIGDTVWVGSIEMHVKSSDWKKHNHSEDRRYDNVILHVVYEEDERIERRTGGFLPCLELKPAHFQTNDFNKERQFREGIDFVPCAGLISVFSKKEHELWQQHLLLERLKIKTRELRISLVQKGYDWEQVYFEQIAKNIGMKVNADVFEELARIVPLSILLRHREQLIDLEALLFGQAGFLDSTFREAYPNKLKERYLHFSRKYGLIPMDKINWKFLRLRPANFPTIRIAQLARLVHQTDRLFGKSIAADSIKELQQMFQLRLSGYWLTHYQFDKESARRQKSLGSPAIFNLVINAVVPFVNHYGEVYNKEHLSKKALVFLNQMPAEKHNISDSWRKIGMEVDSASQSQALLHLLKNYCQKSRCLECAIGKKIINTSGG